MSRTAKGVEARNYFIACERRAKLLAKAVHIPQSLPEALRLAADEAERRAAAEAQLAIAAPKAEALDRIATAEGSLCVTDAAKALQMKPRELFNWLSGNQWIYRRTGSPNWIAYQNRLQAGLLEHKVTTVERNDGSEKVTEQVRVTPKGLAKIAEDLEIAVSA
nr:phage antirepressor KilAC domain-containing protein [Cupriavidus taiwanensis]